MKTILVPVFDGMVARNLLYTDVIQTLIKNGGIRVVIVPPNGKADYYQSQFADGKNIFVDKTLFWRKSTSQFVFEKLFLHSIPTNFMHIRQVDWYWNKGKHITYAGVSILRTLGHFHFWHHLLRFFDSLVPVPKYLEDIMDTWQPDMVFAPTMIARDEVALMRLARRRDKKTIGMFKSWDNPTSKAFLRFFPDAIIAHTEIMKQEAIALYGYPAERIFVTGVPQFDAYAHPDFIEPRESFFKKIGADSNKKLITFAPAGDWMTLYDKEILEYILDWIDVGKLPNCQVLLRLHPAYESKTEELAGRAHLVIERPGKHFEGVDKNATLKSVEFDLGEIRHLGSTMKWSSVTINTASTLVIESAIFDTPVVLLGFDGDKKLSYWKSVCRYYDREHFVPIVRSGGAPMVKSKEELLRALLNYLEDSKLHHEGRVLIQGEQGYDSQGHAGEKVAQVLLRALA